MPEPTAAVAELVDLALAAGAPDNVTAVVADVIEVSPDQDLGSAAGGPVVVGAAMDQRNRAALPGLTFPDDVGPGGAEATAGVDGGPEVAGGLAARNASRARSGGADTDGGVDPEAGELGSPEMTASDTEGSQAPASGASIGAAAGGDLAPDDAGDSALELSSDVEPTEKRGWPSRHWRGLSALGVLLVAGAIGVVGFLWWLNSQWFVGSYFGNVAVYQGVPQQIVGKPLNRVTTTTAVPVRTLPYYDQAQLAGTIEAPTEADALRIVTDLEDKAVACLSPEAPLGCPVLDTPILGLDGGTTNSGTRSSGATLGSTR